MATSATPANTEALETLLFKATNPSNKLEDVNTIKQFCDAVNALPGDGPVIACRILAHKIQSPQEREAIQALAVLEACVKSCGPPFHAEMCKFKFLNEMIKLVSPKYLASRTPNHIKRKVIELLYVWSKELSSENKVAEAYNMLKTQGIITEDPVYLRGAVFASSLPPRNEAVMTEEQTKLLRKLLQSKSPGDLQQANKIIKGLVQEDERKMDALTRRTSELTMATNNSKLLIEILDHYDKDNCGREELELLRELFQACEKTRPKLCSLADEAVEHNFEIVEILNVSENISRAIDRYKHVIIEGKNETSLQDSLLDLAAEQNDNDLNKNDSLLFDDVMIGLNSLSVDTPESLILDKVTKAVNNDLTSPGNVYTSNGKVCVSVDDLLTSDLGADSIQATGLVIPISSTSSSITTPQVTTKFEESKASRVRGLEELDLLGENALRTHLPAKSPQFSKKSEKQSLNAMQNKKYDFPQMKLSPELSSQTPNNVSLPTNVAPNVICDDPSTNLKAVPIAFPETQDISPVAKTSTSVEEVKIANLFIPLTSIKPGSIPPLTLQESSDGISVVLHFGKEQPQEHVSAIVVTIISKLTEAISDFELKAVVPKGCKVKLQPPSSKQLPAHNPFVPPSAITQVMLIANPSKLAVSLKYVLSYVIDGEPQTEMGEVASLPI